MKSLGLSRYALAIGAASVLLTGCGGSQPPIGVPGAMPQSRAIVGHADRGGSWMLPEAKNNDLLYLADDDGNVYVYDYPKFRQVGKLGGLGNVGTEGLCVDRNGDVYVPAWTFHTITGYVFEFAHGGTEPIRTLNNGGENSSCAVDPTTGNLAVTDYESVDIFQNAEGTPTTYAVSNLEPQWLTYDDDGNLFVDGYNSGSGSELAELSKGSGGFTPVTVNQSFAMFSLQWSKGLLNIVSASGASRDNEYVYRVSVSDSSGTVVGKTTLDVNHRGYDGNGQVWIQGNRILGAGRNHYVLDVWRYPSGGHHIKEAAKHITPWGVVVSAAPSH